MDKYSKYIFIRKKCWIIFVQKVFLFFIVIYTHSNKKITICLYFLTYIYYIFLYVKNIIKTSDKHIFKTYKFEKLFIFTQTVKKRVVKNRKIKEGKMIIWKKQKQNSKTIRKMYKLTTFRKEIKQNER